MDSSIKIRRFRRTDAPSIVCMLRKLAAHHKDLSFASEEHFTTHACGPLKSSFIWIAVDNGNPVGFIESFYFMNYVRGKFASRINLLFIMKDYRRQGIGRKLIIAAMNEALNKGVTRLAIGADPCNRGANIAYKKLGLKKERKEHFDYRADDKIMNRIVHAQPKGKHR